MVSERLVPLSLALPKVYKDLLRRIALEESLKSNQNITTSQLGREILCNFLREKLEKKSKKDA